MDSDSDNDDEEKKTDGDVQWARRPVKRGAACRSCLHACWMAMLDTPMGPIALISLLVATGGMAAIWAIVYSGKHWHFPLYSSMCCLIPLIPLFCMGGADEIERLARTRGQDDDNAFRADDTQYALGWFVMGASIMMPFGAPILLGQVAVIPPHLVWISAVGSWCLVASIILGVAFSIRLSYHKNTSDSSNNNG